ncbi:hypothetical protein V8C40DRAFT_230887 [Trichoderma camerunense]
MGLLTFLLSYTTTVCYSRALSQKENKLLLNLAPCRTSSSLNSHRLNTGNRHVSPDSMIRRGEEKKIGTCFSVGLLLASPRHRKLAESGCLQNCIKKGRSFSMACKFAAV